MEEDLPEKFAPEKLSIDDDDFEDVVDGLDLD